MLIQELPLAVGLYCVLARYFRRTRRGTRSLEATEHLNPTSCLSPPIIDMEVADALKTWFQVHADNRAKRHGALVS